MLKVDKIKPLGNQILLKRSSQKQALGKILLPENAQKKPKEGEVVAVGPGKRNKQGKLQALCIKPGDQVLFSSYAGVELNVDEDDYLIISEEDIIGILESN
jgi:chaperonin GroES